MKKLFLAALLAVAVSAGAFAKGPSKVSAVVVNNFKTDFKKASDVSWNTTADYTKATFTLDNERMEAFYNEKGEKVATSRAISLEELPVNAKRAFAKKFEGYTVKEAIELESNDETAYYISAQNEKESVILKVSNSGLSTYQRTKK